MFRYHPKLQRWRWLAVCGALSQMGAVSADDVVVRVGAQALSSHDLERRLAELTPLGLHPFGANREARVRGYLEQLVIPELLLDHAAATRNLDNSAVLRAQRDQLLSQALEHELEKLVVLNELDFQRYYAEHRDQFQRPTAVLLWRILVDSEARARDIIKECRGAQGVARWRELSREHSLDKATHLRDGLLGFVRADGSTDVPQLQVDKALYEAASEVADGEIVAEPVIEGNRFAVVWRRGTRPATSVPLAQATPAIRAALTRDRARAALTDALQKLRQEQLQQFHPEHIELIDYALPSFTPRDAFPPPAASAAPLRPPTATERGLR